MKTNRSWPLRLKIGLGAMAFLILFVAMGSFYAGDLREWNSSKSLEAPSTETMLGFALYGESVLKLVVEGAEAVLCFGVLSVLLSIGAAMGLGYLLATTPVNSLLHRGASYALDVFGAVPGFLLSAVVLYALTPSLWSLVVAFALANWDSPTRLAWSVGRLVVSRPAYLADVGLGYTKTRLFWWHYVPEVFGPLSARFCSLLAFFIVFGASAVVIGVLDATLFPWGALLNQGRHYFDVAPHVFVAGATLIFVSTFCLTMISSGIQRLFEKNLPR